MENQDQWLKFAKHRPSPHHDERPNECDIELLVIHNISLPAGQFGTSYVDDLFMGTIDCHAHESFASLQGVRVSAHCFIRRDGEVIQYVPFSKRAWHAGVSSYRGREKCNDFSIGIELEGTDNDAYTPAQYEALVAVSRAIIVRYPKITTEQIVGHCDIAPVRKTDPGEAFDWSYYLDLLQRELEIFE
ncbi:MULTISPECIES: 1,6-anhydro-N-acetylmuramyl-L-alanine amidase AmpD [Pseudoalteromonas]|uniref:1,6-anhydro-N-acetylmuramyl-L-alanine amidase AmpD n=1 Tax=Pseudoalteromonas obscura TaxID=3048491 RepID=A0ABT7EL97_9GAMM|nr:MULTISPECIES: 1,6-anhydro-N-acetylmuramyl-L-alanine amidase AmpD [Pseudoalteromonas]MBQ4837581.1 1,6-anhydro-N-acetylmuramyl-L-alanine amidase AmpD [Pseudoalteromonas luteoviolacea]MDK2595839.1 1,6-anhydro-N-acetylmuramyl-L-alanine amidase AmpD [Pseudoalteromonas sp. P94(2023)]